MRMSDLRITSFGKMISKGQGMLNIYWFCCFLTSTCRELLNKAVQAYSVRGDIYYPEKSRALYKRHKVQVMLGKKQDAICDADASLQLHRQARPKDLRPFESLTDEDFDKTIVFWSR